jgi:hypothetical protein
MSTLAADAAQLLSSSALADAESAAYWAYHLGRTGFFLGAVSWSLFYMRCCCWLAHWLPSGRGRHLEVLLCGVCVRRAQVMLSRQPTGLHLGRD